MKTIKTSFFYLLLLLCAGLVSCSSSDDESDPGNPNGGSTDGSGKKGFYLQEVGIKHATFTITFSELKRLYLEGLDIPYTEDFDFSQLGISESDLMSTLRYHVYLELSDREDFNSVRGFEPVVTTTDNGYVYTFEGLYPATKHYYRVYHLNIDGRHDYVQYEFTTPSFDEKALTIVTGDANTQHHNLSNYYVNFEESTITIDNIGPNDYATIEYGIVPSFNTSDLTPSKVGSLVTDRNNVSDGLTLKFMRNAGVWSNNKVSVNFSASALRKFEKSTLYYCIYVRLGTNYYLGEIKSVTL